MQHVANAGLDTPKLLRQFRVDSLYPAQKIGSRTLGFGRRPARRNGRDYAASNGLHRALLRSDAAALRVPLRQFDHVRRAVT